MKTVIKILSLSLVYALAGKFGLTLAFVNASASAVWAPTGIALAALLLMGYRVWPGILLGAFIVNLSTAGTVATSLAIAVGNTLEGLAGVYLIRRFANGRFAFDSPYDILKYAVFVALGSTMAAATIGVTTLALGGFARWADYGSIWFTWWMGDAGGDFIVAPLLILWANNLRFSWNVKKMGETGLLFCLLGIFGLAVYGTLLPASMAHYPVGFFITPLLIWIPFRLEKRDAVSAVFFLSAMAIWGTLHGRGPFTRAAPNDGLLLLQLYMGIVSTMILAVSAVVEQERRAKQELEIKVAERTVSLTRTIDVLEHEVGERGRTEAALQASETRFYRLMESNVIGLITVDGEGLILEANDAFLKLVGCQKEQVHQRRLSMRTLIPPEFRAQEEWASQHMRSQGAYPTLETEFIHNNGSHIPVLIGGVQLDRDPVRSVYFVIDVTHRRQAMDALRKAYDEIEVRVDERTQELSAANTELAREIIRRKQAEAELRNQSLLDPLTGLYNRRGFLALAEQQWLQAFRDKRHFLFFFADVDGLKQINDTLGHQRGDQALMEAAEALRRTFRKSDVLSRIGGDEFAVVAAQTPLEQTQVYIDRLKSHLDGVNAAGRLSFKLSLSIGVAMFDQKETTSVHVLMRRADEDLYAHKRLRAI